MTVVVLPAAPTADVTFRALGTDVRLIVTGSRAAAAGADAKRLVLDYHARLSRFLRGSELCALNADPRPVVPASTLLRSAVRAGLWAAERSGGLVDPCLLDALEAAGFERINLELTVEIAPEPPWPERSWELFLERAANPLVPTIGEVVARHLTAEEAERLERHLRPLVECGSGRRRLAVAYYSAVRD